MLIDKVKPDPNLVAVVFGFIGYAAYAAQQVAGFFFGSSRGSDEKTRAMADAVMALGTLS
ncbi:hypothetical protein [Chitinimonas sp. BJYL2]|uniref:hypothetical protein n=1 Tax=Chitinimonas sp. BJYL2 TaxID=2976696 RepID=UPI0022B37684|nr:hypothetical protein [Chitinimonas sp. BJYL2]